MADIKISKLEETNSLSGFYVPGVMENDIGELTTRKFYINNFQDNINKAVNSIQNGVNSFNTSVNYYTGEYVTYGTSVYRFITDHPAGVWDISEVEEVSVYGELESMSFTDNETVHINISSSDDLLINLSNIIVAVTLDNNVCITKYSDSSGNCTFNIPIGQSYTIHLDDQLGYQSIGDSTYTAEIKDRYINIVYQRDISLDTCTVNVKINLPNGGNISDFNELSCFLIKDNYIKYSSNISNGLAVFSDIEKGVSYSALVPNQTDYSFLKNNQSFISDNITLNFDYNYNGIRWQSGLFLLYLDSNNEYREVDLDALYTDPSDTTTWIGDSEYGITKDNALAIHVCPKFLYELGCDFFVRIQDLVKTYSTSSGYNLKYWNGSIDTTFLPNMANTSSNGGIYYENEYLDGEYYTYLLMYYCVYANTTSPILNYIRNERFTYKNNNLIGFFGTLPQMLEIFQDPSKEKIKNVLYSLLYTPTFNSNINFCMFRVSGGYMYSVNGSTCNITSSSSSNSSYALPLFTVKSINISNN